MVLERPRWPNGMQRSRYALPDRVLCRPLLSRVRGGSKEFAWFAVVGWLGSRSVVGGGSVVAGRRWRVSGRTGTSRRL